jgi:DNA repair protein RecO (recombination protein O)
MLLRTEGIVLKSFPYGEADLLVTYLTLDHGLRKAFAKSPRKTKSRFGSSLEPFTHARIALMGREDAALPRLTQSDIVRSYQGLREDYDCFLRASGVAELTLGFLPEGERAPEVFHLLSRTLDLLESSCTPLAVLAYKVRFLSLKGYLPRLGECGRCGAGTQTFYVSQGSVLCGPCASSRDTARPDDHLILTLTPGSVRLFETLQTWELEKLGRIRASEAMLSELSALLDAHVEHTTSRPLRTSRFGQPTA